MRSTLVWGRILSLIARPSLYCSPRKRLYWKTCFKSPLAIAWPSTMFPLGCSKVTSTSRTRNGTSDGFSTRKSNTAMLSESPSAPVRTFRIFPCSTKCAPLVCCKMATTASATATIPTPKKIRNRLLISALVSQQLPVPLQAADIVAEGFHRGRDRNSEHQPDTAPQCSPKHQCHGHHQWVQVHARAHHFGVEQVQSDQMQHRDHDNDHQVYGRFVVADQTGQQRRPRGQR